MISYISVLAISIIAINNQGSPPSGTGIKSQLSLFCLGLWFTCSQTFRIICLPNLLITILHDDGYSN